MRVIKSVPPFYCSIDQKHEITHAIWPHLFVPAYAVGLVGLGLLCCCIMWASSLWYLNGFPFDQSLKKKGTTTQQNNKGTTRKTESRDAPRYLWKHKIAVQLIKIIQKDVDKKWNTTASKAPKQWSLKKPILSTRSKRAAGGKIKHHPHQATSKTNQLHCQTKDSQHTKQNQEATIYFKQPYRYIKWIGFMPNLMELQSLWGGLTTVNPLYEVCGTQKIKHEPQLVQNDYIGIYTYKI